MSKPTHHRHSLGAALLAALLIPTSRAQTTAAAPAAPAGDESIITLEAFVATGSNIKRLDQEKVLPVTVLNTEQIEARDATTSLDLLAGIPQITDIPRNETSTNAVAARGDNANVALRGLGEENTLVLINGRRLPFQPFNTSSVNVNMLPVFGIQQIEVLRDGASAIYGSDAVAGVVNYITEKTPAGGKISVRYGITEDGGGMDVGANIGYGTTFANGKGTWILSLSAYNRDAIYFKERDISASSNRSDQARAPWNVAGSVYDGRSATGYWPSFRFGADASTGTVNWFYPNAGGTPALTQTALPRDLYADYNQYTIGQPMTARGSIYNRIEYQLTSSIRAFGEVSGYVSKSQTARQPITLNASDARVTLAIDNPYNPYGSRFYSLDGTPNADGTARLTGRPQAITINSMLMTEGGPEDIEATGRMYRLLGGLSGSIGTSSWTWETAAMVGGVRVTDFATNSVRESKLKEAAMRTDATAWNPFGYTFKVENGAVVANQRYRNPDSVIDYFTESADRYGHSKIASVDARFSGEVVELWAGPISAAIGAEWRWEYKEDHKDPYVSVNPADSGLDPNNNDILVMSPKFNFDADRTIYSAYAETVVPLVAPKNDVAFTNSLEIDASVRFERYSDFGETTKPKFGVNWKPLSWIMVRGSLNEGFRAPDLADLYQPASFTVGSPPGTRDTVRNNFFTNAGLAADEQVLARTYSLSNRDLQPEESTGRSVGIAVDVPKIRGLSFTVDYWEIEQENLILTKTRDSALDEQLLHAYTQQQLAQGRNIMEIDVGSHTTPDGANTYVGDPNTLRNPVTQADRDRFAAAYARTPQSQWIAPLGTWVGSVSQLINGTGRNFTNGIDYSISYNLPRNRFGQFRVTTEWSQFLNKFTKETPDDPKDDEINAMLIPEWKSSTTIYWRKDNWSASLNATYATDIRTNARTNAAGYAAAGSPDYIVPVYNNGTLIYFEEGQDQLQLNLGVTYRFETQNKWLRDTSVRLGINNLLNEEPSLVAANEAGSAANVSGYSGSMGTSLWVGRAYSLTIERRF